MSNIITLGSALDITRRISPRNIKKNLFGIISLCPKIGEELLQRSEVPLLIKYDDIEKKYFIACEYNRECDSYRSPYSNKFFPPLSCETEHSSSINTENLRKLEIEYNHLLDSYREIYYNGGVSSAYSWPLQDDDGYAVALAIRKEIDNTYSDSEDVQFIWNSLHVIEVIQSSNSVNYKMVSSLLLISNTVPSPNSDDMAISINKTIEQNRKIVASDKTTHVHIVGQMVEESETIMQKSISNIYFPKTQEIIGNLRVSNFH